jgi:catechol 2,3-dioxygenase-like lactoylglutathione lyase family enzyme
MPLPGLRRVDHVGLTVPNLDEAVAFFRNVLGGRELYRVGPFKSDDDWMQRYLGVHPRAEVTQLAVVRMPGGPDLELFEYVAPDQRPQHPRNSDIGAAHLAFMVDDLDAVLAQLPAHGLEPMGEPVTMTEGPSAGLTWLYALSPWGLQLEFVSAPEGLAFEREGAGQQT